MDHVRDSSVLYTVIISFMDYGIYHVRNDRLIDGHNLIYGLT